MITFFKTSISVIKTVDTANDPDIKSIRLDIKINGQIKTFERKELYDNMFLFV